MSSSTSSSNWRSFFRTAVGTAALLAVVIYGFVVSVDPFDILPLSPPADRVQVASNARFAFPSLARSSRYSAIFACPRAVCCVRLYSMSSSMPASPISR